MRKPSLVKCDLCGAELELVDSSGNSKPYNYKSVSLKSEILVSIGADVCPECYEKILEKEKGNTLKLLGL